MANPLTAFMVRPIQQRRNAKKLIITAPNGIRDERFVTIGGIQQWVSIRGQDRANPVLLILHGGPGSPYTPFSSWLLEWEKHFTIVQWDQRGSGKTFQKNSADGSGTLTLDTLAKDGIELSEYVRRELQQEKIIVIASSRGSLIGSIMIHRRPDLFWAYVGTEQNSPSDRAMAYKLIKDAAQKANNKKGLALLNGMGDTPKDWTPKQTQAMDELGIKLSTAVPNMVYDLMLPALLFNPDYKMDDIKNVQKGMEFSTSKLFDELMSFDLRTLGSNVTIPYFIFQGEKDILTPVAAAKDYFDNIIAPQKKFVLIQNAGHLAAFCNPDQFLRELLTYVRPLVSDSKDKKPQIL